MLGPADGSAIHHVLLYYKLRMLLRLVQITVAGCGGVLSALGHREMKLVLGLVLIAIRTHVGAIMSHFHRCCDLCLDRVPSDLGSFTWLTSSMVRGASGTGRSSPFKLTLVLGNQTTIHLNSFSLLTKMTLIRELLPGRCSIHQLHALIALVFSHRIARTSLLSNLRRR